MISTRSISIVVLKLYRRCVQQRSGYEILAAIRCEPLRFFVGQQSTLAGL